MGVSSIIRAARGSLLVAGAMASLGASACAHTGREVVSALPGPALAIPRGNPIELDIANGFRLYGSTLERWGRWSDDALYAVRWCPRGVDPARFVPYQSDGHWTTSEPGPTDAGAPRWLSDDASTWSDITTHHGWWVHLDQSTPEGVWCWIPGAEETVARVVWREADGFVAWAPEPPLYVDPDVDDADTDTLAWSFELLGTLLDDVLEPALLHGDAAAIASRATWVARHRAATSKHGHVGSLATARRVGPPAREVAAARRALSGYVTAHPVVASEALPTTPTRPTRSAPASDETFATVTAKTRSRWTEDPLPPSMVLYEQMIHDPFAGVGPPPSAYLPFLALGARMHGMPGLPVAPGVASTVAASKSSSTSEPSPHSRGSSGTSHTHSGTSSTSRAK